MVLKTLTLLSYGKMLGESLDLFYYPAQGLLWVQQQVKELRTQSTPEVSVYAWRGAIPLQFQVLVEKTRALFGHHHTWFEFYLDLFIQSPVLLTLTWCFPACFFFLTLPKSETYHINHMATKY